MEELLTAMKGILLVQLQLLLPPEQREKPELLLHKAGFSSLEIADFLGKSKAAVQKSIERSR